MKKIFVAMLALLACAGMSSAKPQAALDESSEFEVTISLDASGNVTYSQDGVVTISSENVEVLYLTTRGYYCWINQTTNVGRLRVEPEKGYVINRVLFLMDGDDASQVTKEMFPFDVFLYDQGIYTSLDGVGDSDRWQGNHVYEIRVYCEPGAPATDKTITAEEDPGTGTYYTTFFDSENQYKLPFTAEAYIVTLGTDSLSITKIAGSYDVIPANTPVIFRGAYAEITLELSEETPVSFTATNSLQGTDFYMTAPENCFRLGLEPYETEPIDPENELPEPVIIEKGVGFYRYHGAIPAHSAYLLYNGEKSRLPLDFIRAENIVAGIENTKANAKTEKRIENGQLFIIKNGVRYNAQGQIIK
jgi:hypothetical protein